MSIMDMFKSVVTPSPAPAAPASGAGQPGNIPPSAQANATGAANSNTAPNGVVPAGSSDPANPTPLDPFTDLWKNDVKPGEENKDTSGALFTNVDPQKFMEAAGKIDFSKAVTPEQVQAISSGGDAAIQAFASAMNKVAQNVYAQSAFATTKIVDAALAKAKEGYVAELPQHVKRLQVSDNLRGKNPIFSNPAVQPIISALESQLTVKYPNATASEITSMAEQFVEAVGTSFSPAKPDPNTSGKQETDWSSFIA